jgi:hypothetical protein
MGMRRAPREQSGAEAARPAPAPPGARFGLALFGLVMSVVGMVVLATFGHSWWGVTVLGALAFVAAVDTGVQARQMHPHRRW